MAVQNPNNGRDPRGDDGPDDAPQLNSILGVEEYRTRNGLQTYMTRLGEAQAGAAEARNGAAEARINAVEERNNAVGVRTNAVEARNNASEASNNASEARNRAPEARERAAEARSNASGTRSNAAGTRNNATEGRNGAASKNKKSKKKKWEENKKQTQEGKVCPLFQESGQCRYGDNCKNSHTLPDTLPSPDDKANPDPPKKEKDSLKKEKDSPVNLFFGKYPEFDYMRDKPLWDEFDRMNQHCKLRGAEKNQIRAEFHIALVEEFNHVFGMDEGSLESWGKLCATMGLSTPTTLEEAHKIVRDAYVNLVVLVQGPRTGEPVKVFKSAEDLKEFTTETKWTFPQKHAQAGGLLKMLIRKMGGPSHGPGSRGKKKAVAK
ncbi:hypothetical protein CEP54_010025 [Fusarium duplospermum]|uniref:C3H1-type domain-containing protein n=1 Tax=Fusarium duplospermum TaxID=1325734 RepID=A0A428PM82_9HYPO|nr:hypothetical protein CEP54_010025 [Fusarium duplospermum]